MCTDPRNLINVVPTYYFTMRLFLLLAALAYAAESKTKPTNRETDVTAFGYLKRYGVPAAEARRRAEEKLLSSRIFGGEVSEEGQIPYQVMLHNIL